MRRPAILLLAAATSLAACLAEPTPIPTSAPTTFPLRPAAEAAAAAERYVAAWAARDYPAMHAMLAAADRQRYPLDRFAALHAAFADMARVTDLTATTGPPEQVALPPEARPAELPPPTPTPVPSVDPSASPSATPAEASPTPSPIPEQSFDPAAPLEGPVPGMGVPLDLTIATDRFGTLDLQRTMSFVHGPDGWLGRWTPQLLFPELGPDGELRLDRALGPRGGIVGVDGTVYATTREDGVRIYPQEWLAGQVVGYLSPVTAEDLERLEARGYRSGDVVGRSGLEGGAEDLLRGTPGWTLTAVAADGRERVLYRTEMVPGATLTITLVPELQATAQNAIGGYAQAATAVVDPADGDVWALASSPPFNPNAMTLGTTLAGQPLPEPTAANIINKALLVAYPAGSSFKPFTLAAGLKTGVVTPASLVSCPPTWPFANFTFRNYMDHSLAGLVSLAEAMAFSCNTTYMPLGLQVYQTNPTAFTDLLREFGFGQETGIRFVIEELGVLPDEAWMQENRNASFGPFDQVQLAIGQGAYLGTPLQLANAYAAIGNGGTRWASRLVVSATLPDGTVVEQVQPAVAQRISMTREQLAYVTDTLQAVVTLPYGTGTAAFAGFGIPVAGKSGTAETGGPDPHAWFPAFAPADDPSIVVATVLPYIRLGTGGTDAAPLVRIVMAAHFN